MLESTIIKRRSIYKFRRAVSTPPDLTNRFGRIYDSNFIVYSYVATQLYIVQLPLFVEARLIFPSSQRQ